MKKYKLILGVLLGSQNAFALTDQINLAEKYSFKKNGIVLAQNNSTSMVNSSDILVDNRDNQINDNYVDLTSDIYPGQNSKKFGLLAKQWGLPETTIYDNSLEKKVKKIQSDAGLNPTGIIDRNSWYVLYDQPQEWKTSIINQAINNWKSILEKHKNHASDKMIVINVPSMKLYLYKRNPIGSYSLLMESRVVVGRTKTQTPLRDFEIISLKYNPTWTPTPNILKRNLYKKGELNVKWLEDHGLMLVDENGEKREYNELTTLEKAKFIQPSGDKNALGNLKFETSSKDDIYLHDTNERHLFSYNTRTYSSGCIRVQDYVSLAGYISEKGNDYIQANIDKGKMYFERVPKRIPVYFDYSQVHLNDENTPRFYADVYYKNKKK